MNWLNSSFKAVSSGKQRILFQPLYEFNAQTETCIDSVHNSSACCSLHTALRLCYTTLREEKMLISNGSKSNSSQCFLLLQ